MIFSRMLRIWSCVLVCIAAIAARGEGDSDFDFNDAKVPALLREALAPYRGERERWAYTETTIGHLRNRKGVEKAGMHTVARYDPSLPEDEQWTLIETNGRPPSDKEKAEFLRQHSTKPGGKSVSISGKPDFDHIVVREETPESVTYELPVVSGRGPKVAEKLSVLVRVNKTGKVVEEAHICLRENFRVKAVVKVSGLNATATLRRVDPQYPPQVVSIRGNFGGSFLFMKFNGEQEVTRTDFRRVKPWRDRFEVKLGPLEFLDF